MDSVSVLLFLDGSCWASIVGSPDYRRVSVQLIGFGISGSRYFWFNEPELRFVYKPTFSRRSRLIVAIISSVSLLRKKGARKNPFALVNTYNLFHGRPGVSLQHIYMPWPNNKYSLISFSWRLKFFGPWARIPLCDLLLFRWSSGKNLQQLPVLKKECVMRSSGCPRQPGWASASSELCARLSNSPWNHFLLLSGTSPSGSTRTFLSQPYFSTLSASFNSQIDVFC